MPIFKGNAASGNPRSPLDLFCTLNSEIIASPFISARKPSAMIDRNGRHSSLEKGGRH